MCRFQSALLVLLSNPLAPQPHPHPPRVQRNPEYYPTDDEQWDRDGYGDGYDEDGYGDGDQGYNEEQEGEGQYDEDPDYVPTTKYSEEYSAEPPVYATTQELSNLEKAVRSLAVNMMGFMTWNKMLEQGLDILQGHDGAGWRAALEGLNAFVPFQLQEEHVHALTNNVKQTVVSALNFLPGETTPAAALHNKPSTPQHVQHVQPAPISNNTVDNSNRSAIKATAPKLTKNGDVRDFLAKLNIYFNLAKVPAHEQIDIALLNVESPDLVDMWFGHVKSHPLQTFTFQQFAERLTIFAGGHSVQSKALDDFYASCKQHKMCVDAYIRKFNTMVTAAGWAAV
jgi:hypothetical protein